MSVRSMASPFQAARSARDAFAPPPEPQRGGQAPRAPMQGQRPSAPAVRADRRVPAQRKSPQTPPPHFVPTSPSGNPVPAQQRVSPRPQNPSHAEPFSPAAGRPYFPQQPPRHPGSQPSGRRSAPGNAYPSQPGRPAYETGSSPYPGRPAARMQRPVPPAQDPYAADYQAGTYSEELPYQTDSSYDPYAARRNTLEGDPYDNYRPQNSLMKWLPTILSGVVFLICLILLIMLLTD